MPAGRPTKYTKELADSLCSELSQGKSLRKVCESDEYPSAVTIFSWLRTNDEFLKQYEMAKQESADSLVDEILDIADNDASEPLLVNGEPVMENGKPVTIKTAVGVQHARLKVDARKWVASKLKPKKYGDKVELSNDPDNPIPPQLIFQPLAKPAKDD